MSSPSPPHAVRARRLALGWSQQELAGRAGLSRAGVSAIEAGRLTPSVSAALALSRALACTVEDLFAPAAEAAKEIEWAVPPGTRRPRYWQARVGDRLFAYPVGEDSLQLDWHDGVFQPKAFRQPQAASIADRTVVVAGCDPAGGLLAAEYARQTSFRMIALRRSSREALELLASGKVHAAGIHLSHGGRRDDNARIAQQQLGQPCELVRVARWEEGLAVAPRLKSSTTRSLTSGKAQWVGREPGSGARQCQDEILGERAAPLHIAYDHRSVAAAIKCGWADVGPCVRLASEESGLAFLKLSDKDYDLCIAGNTRHDPRIAALFATLRSQSYRQRLAELPGYSTKHTGELVG